MILQQKGCFGGDAKIRIIRTGRDDNSITDFCRPKGLSGRTAIPVALCIQNNQVV